MKKTITLIIFLAALYTIVSAQENNDHVNYRSDKPEYINISEPSKYKSDEIPVYFVIDHLDDPAYQNGYEYSAIRVGEYYWVNENFQHILPNVPHDNLWTGTENSYPVTQARLDYYMPQANLDGTQYQLENIEDFVKYYGMYYSRPSITYMSKYGKIMEGQNRQLTGWKLPNNEDYRQLFAMCPFLGFPDEYLDEYQVRIALSCRNGDNPLTIDIDDPSGGPYRTYWFEYSTNQYGFNMMPGGSRLHSDFACWMNAFGTYCGPIGGFNYLFYTVSYATEEGQVCIHDRVDTGDTSWQWSWYNIRWCRKLTDEELGYKLYLSTESQEIINSEEWALMRDGDETPLLKAVKAATFSRYNLDIIKTGVNDTPPDNSVELPKGYIRGFYVHHIMMNPTLKCGVTDVLKYAFSVDDNSLDGPVGVDPLDGIIDTGANHHITVYPNPAENDLYIESLNSINSIKIYSLQGQIVRTYKNAVNKIDISELVSGVYIVSIQTDKGCSNHKIYKK